MKNLEITVSINVHGDGRNDVYIGFPKGQEKVSVQDAAHMLAAGINLLVKSCNNHDVGISDHELQTEIIEHMNNEFASTRSYYDAEILDKSLLKNKDELD